VDSKTPKDNEVFRSAFFSTLCYCLLDTNIPLSVLLWNT